jgi:MFS family permease
MALPVPVWALALMLAVLGFCLGVGQPLSMTTVVQAAPDDARSTALALRLTGNRLGQVAAPAAAGLVAGVAGVAAPFLMLGVLLVGAAGVGMRSGGGGSSGRGLFPKPAPSRTGTPPRTPLLKRRRG